MVKLTDLEYLQLSWVAKFWYKFLNFWIAIPKWFVRTGKKIGRFFAKCGIGIGHFFTNLVMTFVRGSWKTKLSYLIFGFGNAAHGQWLRGLLFFAYELCFIFYMIFFGGSQLGKMFHKGSIGTEGVTYSYINDPIIGKIKTEVYHDDSFMIVLWGILTLCFILCTAYTWYQNIKQAGLCEQLLSKKKKLATAKDDLRSLVDEQFHKTLLALPVAGIFLFTVLPMLFMIAVAFTDYDKSHNGLKVFWKWVGFQNFATMFNWNGQGGNLSSSFGEILLWTLIWAFFATFSNYFLGMLVAMAINKKGIKLKKLWRGVLVLSSAIPQFISVTYVSKLFSDSGLVNSALIAMGGHAVKWWTSTANHALLPRVMVIIINIWIGIPYLMLITSGVLMNIPADLYESARIDGANPWQQLRKITVPYMFFVTGPYLLTSFTGNLNNFNVIYLLTGGAPINPALSGTVGSVGYTDLLITWLYKIAIGTENDFKTASVLGILIFLIVAFLSLIVYNILPSNKNEEDFQ